MRIKIKLRKGSLVAAILGIILLLIISASYPPKLTNIGNINDKLLNKKVEVRGEIFNIKTYNNFHIISIRDDTGKIDLTLNSNQNFTSLSNIIATGKVKEYKEFLQIEVENLNPISE